jgi:hypothetical protein
MASITGTDSGALEHILSIILAEPPSTSNYVTIPPFRACFSKAGIFNASDFISKKPNVHGSISFDIASSGEEDPQLNIIQKSNPPSFGITKFVSYGVLLVLR